MKLSCSRIVVEFTLQSLPYIEYGMDVARMVKDRIFYERGAATMWTITPLHLYTMGLPVSGGKSDLVCYCVLDGDTFHVYVIAEGAKDLAERACDALRQVMIAAKRITPGAKIGLIAKNAGMSGDDELFDCAFFIDGFLTASGVRERGQDKRSGFYVRIAPNCASVMMANVDTPINYEPIWQPGVSVDTTVRAIAAFANWSSGTSSVKFPTMIKTREWVDVDGGWVYEEGGIGFFMMWSDGSEFRVVVQNMTTKVQSDFSIYVAGRKPGTREQLMVARDNIERLAKVTTKASDTPIPTLFAPFYIVARDVYSGVRLFAVAPDLVISGEIAKTLMRQGPGLKDIRIMPFADLSERQREGNWENEPAIIPRGTTGSAESGWLLVDHPIPNSYITSGWVYTGQNHDAWMKLAAQAKVAVPEKVKVGLDEFEAFYTATMRSWIMSAEAVDHDALAQKAHQTGASPEQVASVIVRVDKRKIGPLMKKHIEFACRELWSRNGKANPIMNPAAGMGGMVISFKQSEPFITLIQSMGQIDQLCNADHALKVIFDSNGKFVIPFPSEDGRAPFAMMDAIYDTIARVVDGKTSVDIEAPGITRFFDGEFSDLLIDAALAINGWTSGAFMYADEMEANANKMEHLVLHQNCDESAATLIGARTEKPDTITIMVLDSIREDQQTESATFWVKLDKHGIAGIGGENQWAVKMLPHGSLYGSFYQIVMDSTKFERGPNGEQKILTGPVDVDFTEEGNVTSDLTKQMIATIEKSGNDGFRDTANAIKNELSAGFLTEKEADALLSTMIFAQNNQLREFFVMWLDSGAKVHEIGWATPATADLLKSAFNRGSKTKIAIGYGRHPVDVYGAVGGPSAKHMVLMMKAKLIAPGGHVFQYKSDTDEWLAYGPNGYVARGSTPDDLLNQIDEMSDKESSLAEIRSDGFLIGMRDRKSGVYQSSISAPDASDVRKAESDYGHPFDKDELRSFIDGYVDGLTRSAQQESTPPRLSKNFDTKNTEPTGYKLSEASAKRMAAYVKFKGEVQIRATLDSRHDGFQTTLFLCPYGTNMAYYLFDGTKPWEEAKAMISQIGVKEEPNFMLLTQSGMSAWEVSATAFYKEDLERMMTVEIHNQSKPGDGRIFYAIMEAGRVPDNLSSDDAVGDFRVLGKGEVALAYYRVSGYAVFIGIGSQREGELWLAQQADLNPSRGETYFALTKEDFTKDGDVNPSLTDRRRKAAIAVRDWMKWKNAGQKFVRHYPRVGDVIRTNGYPDLYRIMNLNKYGADSYEWQGYVQNGERRGSEINGVFGPGDVVTETSDTFPIVLDNGFGEVVKVDESIIGRILATAADRMSDGMVIVAAGEMIDHSALKQLKDYQIDRVIVERKK